MAIDRVVLRAWGDRYVTVPGGVGHLTASAHAIGPWEIFRLTWVSDDVVGIQCHDGTYVRLADAETLYGYHRKVGDTERFRVIWHGDDRVTFVAPNGKYVCAEVEGDERLVANRGGIGEWEKFFLEQPPPL